MGTYRTASATNGFYQSMQPRTYQTDLLVVIDEGTGGKSEFRFRERNRYAHCINGARLNNRTIPNLPDVVVLTRFGGLLEVIMQRRVEDAEL